MGARGSSACLPGGTSPCGVNASNRSSAFDHGRNISVQDIICEVLLGITGSALRMCTRVIHVSVVSSANGRTALE